MYLRVRYSDDRYDYSPDFMLDTLILMHDIDAFYRPSERRWIRIGRDRTRDPKTGSSLLRQGRRKTDMT